MVPSRVEMRYLHHALLMLQHHEQINDLSHTTMFWGALSLNNRYLEQKLVRKLSLEVLNESIQCQVNH